MTTILFVHGTGVREQSYQQTLALLDRKLGEHLDGYRLHGAAWGDPLGARLNAGGKSIPEYALSGDPSASLESAELALWHLLTHDPLLELRTLPDAPHIGVPPGARVWQRLCALPNAPAPQGLTQAWGLAPRWQPFLSDLALSPSWRQVVSSLSVPEAAASEKVARAVTAAFLIHVREEGFPGLTGAQRDQLTRALVEPLGGAALGVSNWILGRLTSYARPRRGALCDTSGPAVADILRYQTRGEQLRRFIAYEVQRTHATILLTHSLGGIACFDWLATQQTPITHLITVGSQAPWFYEIDALASLPYGSALPASFPASWLNILDPRDFLSFCASPLFAGRAQDVLVDNGEPFPEAHGAYWHNDHVWRAIRSFLQP